MTHDVQVLLMLLQPSTSRFRERRHEISLCTLCLIKSLDSNRSGKRAAEMERC